MSTKIGHFEILSELAKSATGAVYKANDPQTSQTVALKAIQLSAFGDRAAQLEKSLLEEAEATKALSHPNLTTVYGAGEIDGRFYAAMEYIQGNSIATMVARKEGFSIWDLLDIGRQVCSGLDHAQSLNIAHYSLEPAKIMCGWDGTVRVLGYGVSSVGKFADRMPGLPSFLPYLSPEQISSGKVNGSSNLFSLGAIFYEMVTDQHAFEGASAEALRLSIVNNIPVAPIAVNPKIHPALSDLIMKALSKDPAARYQSGRELLDDLEQCKESKPQTTKPATVPASGVVVQEAVKAATQAKFIASAAPTPKPSVAPVPSSPVAAKPPSALPAAVPRVPAPPASAPAGQKPPIQSKPVQTQPSQTKPVEKKISMPPTAPGKAAAASASVSAAPSPANSPRIQAPTVSAKPAAVAPAPSASMTSSSAVLDKPVAKATSVVAPKIAVDPMMAEDAPSGSGKNLSFSEMTELPPLKEIYTAPTPPSPAFEQHASAEPSITTFDGDAEQIKNQPHELAQQALKEIKNVPPQLMVYSIAGAAVLILIIAVALVMHVNSLNSDGDAPRPVAAEPQPAPSQPTHQSEAAQPQPTSSASTQAQLQPQAQTQPQVQSEPQPSVAVAAAAPASAHALPAAGRGKGGKKKAPVPAVAVVVPGQMAVDSTPQGAQVQIDGKTDPSWVTPFSLSGLAPGAHSITVSKANYATDSRTVDVVSGSKSFVVTHLAPLAATLAVSSTPAGANVYVDGKDSGKLTPAQVSVDKGQHVVLVRKSGFIDETTSAQFIIGQTVSISPTLRPLGNVDDIKTVGKMKKLFGGKEAQGMGTVSIKTQPKGAQVAVNQHMLEKESPVDFILDPGNYVIDITLTGYASIHKVITVDKGGKAVIDEVLQRQ